MTTMTREICPKCNEREVGYKDVKWCKPCWSQRNKEYYLKNRSKIRLQRGYEEQPQEPRSQLQKLEYYMFRNAKARAKRKGIEFSITIDDIVIPTHCPVLDMELTLNRQEKFNHSSPSLDRINNSKGYVKGNVRVISNRANTLKRDGVLHEFKRLVEYMERHEDGQNTI